MAQTLPYKALSEAPKDIRRAARVALVSNSLAHVTTIIIGAIIVALLPVWFQGLVLYQPFSIVLLLLLLGSIFVSRKGSRIRGRIAAREFEQARSSSFSAAMIGLVLGGVVSGLAYLYLYGRIGDVMVKRRPDDPSTVYLLPQPSGGMFLGRYLGWIAAYLFVLYFGYTQLPPGLKGVSDWLSPVFGVHFNTLIVAVYLVFTNPLTYPPVFQLWMFAGLLGGVIAGGKVSRGYLVGLTAFLSTLGAMGLAALLIMRNLNFSTFLSVPPPPPGFSLTNLATGPVTSDFLPVFLYASSPTDPAFLQNVALILVRNVGLVFLIVTISGRASCLFWQGGVAVARFLVLTVHKQLTLKSKRTTLDRPALKTAAIILLILLPYSTFSLPSSSLAIYHAAMSSPYEQNLAISIDVLGSPNASLRMTNLDLSNNGVTMSTDFSGSSMAAFVVNNNYSETLGNGPQSSILQLVSQPTFVTFYSGSSSASSSKSDSVASRFSQALGMQLILVLSLPMNSGTVRLYVPNQQLSNYDALTKIIGLLPPASFSNLVNTGNLQSLKYFGMIGLVPSTNNTIVKGFSFVMNIQWPRLFYKSGPHVLSLKSLLGFQGNIRGDASANVSIINMTFQRGTVLYSSLFPNPFYNNSTSTYLLNAATGSWPDFSANFAYPFAPNIVINKILSSSTGPIKSNYNVTVTVQNLDSVTVSSVNVTDVQASSDYLKNLQTLPAGVQSFQTASLSPGDVRSMSYTVTPLSSGQYILSPAIVSFLWRASNGSQLRYMINSDRPSLESVSGPFTQFTSSFNDLFPYSLILVIPLMATPIWETFKLLGRQRKRRRESKKDSLISAKAEQARPPQQGDKPNPSLEPTV